MSLVRIIRISYICIHVWSVARDTNNSVRGKCVIRTHSMYADVVYKMLFRKQTHYTDVMYKYCFRVCLYLYIRMYICRNKTTNINTTSSRVDIRLGIGMYSDFWKSVYNTRRIYCITSCNNVIVLYGQFPAVNPAETRLSR